ncbi:MAG TPA: hypothetical protein VMT64_00785 [Candidatus Binataceae bacterium]|nr:hypothetical protein [Candidatus Binataceae bacterium]
MVDNRHTSWNPNETTLTIANVKSSFQLLFADTTDSGVPSADQGTYAQPLYVPGLSIPGQGTHNVIFVATEANNVYAFDADSQGGPLWQVNLTPSGETLQNMNDYANTRIPQMGISGTPVIDPSTNTMYLVAATKTTASTLVFHQRLHALDITTGNEKFGGPIDIQAKYPGSGGEQDGHGNVVFDPLIEFDRGGLTLLGSTVYIPFSAHEDNGLGTNGNIVGNGMYQGWVLAYDKTSLAQVGVYNDSPNLTSGTGGGSIWQAAVGLAADDSSLYALTANGAFDSNGDYGDSLLRLTQAPTISPADSFTPCNQQALNAGDVDLGSGAPMVLPPQSGGPPNLLTFSGKEGTIYLINRSNLGGYTATTVPDSAQCNDKVVQKLWRVLGVTPSTKSDRNAFWGAPAYFADSSGRQYIYYTGDYAPILEYDLANGALTPGKNPSGAPNQTPATEYNFARGGTLPTISSNGGDTSTAILWAIKHASPATSSTAAGPLTLNAYPANDLTTILVNDIPAGNWNFNNDAFIVPTIVNGKVYVSASGTVNVYGVSAGSSSPTPTATPTATPTPGSSGKLHVNRKRIAFGRVRVGKSRTQYFRVSDTGKGPLNVTIGELQGPFQMQTTGFVALAKKGSSEKVGVTFMPTAEGFTGPQTLAITSNDPKTPEFDITVQGTGVAPPH